MTVPSVTVVIPAYNEERFIGRCLRSIVDLNYPAEKLRIVVADNSSTDNTKNIASAFSLEVVDVPRSTIASTRNRVALQADSELIAFVDADCVVTPEWLKAAAKHFLNSSVVAVGSYPSVIKEESNEFQVTMSKLYRRSETDAVPVDWLPSSNMIVRRNAFQSIGGFNEQLVTCEDSDVGYRLRRLGKLSYDNNVAVYHLREPKNLKELFFKERWRSRGNLHGFFSHGMSLSEIPSVFFPIVFAVGAWVSVLGLLLGSVFSLAGIVLSLMPVLIYSIRGYKKVGTVSGLPFIYLSYFSARSISVCADLLTSTKFAMTACLTWLAHKLNANPSTE